MQQLFVPNIEEAVWDLETNGLLDAVSVIHTLVITDVATSVSYRFNDQGTGSGTIKEGLARLVRIPALIAHNGTAYDCEVVRKLHDIVIPWAQQRDTMVLSRLVWPELARMDMDRLKKKEGKDFPRHLIGRVSLEAWGHRLGNYKGDYEGDSRIPDPEERKRRKWDEWNPDMEDYCVQDTLVTLDLWRRIKKRVASGECSEVAVLLETQVAHILARQVRHGFLFNERAAAVLYAKLVARRLELEAEVRQVFRARYLAVGKVFTPAKDSKLYGYVAGAPLTKVVLTDINLTSRDHVATWLRREYGWQPDAFGADGKPTIDEAVIDKLPYAEAKPLKEYFMVSKRIGQVADGKEAWLKKVGKDGRMHGNVNTNGAATGRMTHSGPNMGQVPAGYSPYGHDCRALFCVPLGKVLVGCDAAALELRDLAGYMARYDGGAYVKTVLEGNKADGTDIHSVNAKAIGLDPKALYFDGETGRDIAKTWFYAFIYGAGDEKLGFITSRKKGPSAVKRGKEDRATFLHNLPALGMLVKAVKAKAKERGYLVGLDGRKLEVRSQHAALNTLLQSAGAVQMKRALCLLDDSLQEAGLIPGVNYEFVANVHDEWQIEVDDGLQERVGKLAVEAIRKAGESFSFRCPLDGEWRSGATWADTH